MWKKKGLKRQEEGEPADNDDASRGRKLARKDSAAADDSGFVCELSNTRRVSVRSLGGKILVDIREYYNKDGKLLPGKKGLVFVSCEMNFWLLVFGVFFFKFMWFFLWKRTSFYVVHALRSIRMEF